MAISFNKRELEKKKEQKRQEKQKRKEERKANGGASFEDMIAYVDENGVITDTPPDRTNKQKIDVEDIAISTPKKEDMEDPVLNGRVEHFNSEKGYGFIKHTGSTDKYFFHVSSAPASITEGNIVTFELERGQKGMNAVRIALANKNEQ
ncbi:cold shock CspA family protein [Dysgonomonas sp. PFB1-18]|uniref:cold-shock protein n=1 Tax=unclassified Dysgonomonas TaxID=2630389 RepID=UPI002476A201|nr:MULTISPECIES: cold shock domain-containing protein [unclassified Dysgonomonas]MDH6310634.1 cold shock CspA family protein [Dysgonomonas sp. PF1-14]MDH6340485.1 cold shock CspA family protein [Dysgonomonas sp. PF1-16]MDH6382107.1 cold shock CspA family protein [Dysgonomonas sp. PFB1-18]MDH6399451.1 cold shock CspA family protein [Dysgonomonas sp. PF1-23]